MAILSSPTGTWNWTLMNFPSSLINLQDRTRSEISDNGQIIFITTNSAPSALFKSVDGGATFTGVTLPGNTDGLANTLRCSPDGQIVYVRSADYGSGPDRTWFVSTNAGDTFTSIVETVTANTILNSHFLDTSGRMFAFTGNNIDGGFFQKVFVSQTSALNYMHVGTIPLTGLSKRSLSKDGTKIVASNSFDPLTQYYKSVNSGQTSTAFNLPSAQSGFSPSYTLSSLKISDDDVVKSFFYQSNDTNGPKSVFIDINATVTNATSSFVGGLTGFTNDNWFVENSRYGQIFTVTLPVTGRNTGSLHVSENYGVDWYRVKELPNKEGAAPGGTGSAFPLVASRDGKYTVVEVVDTPAGTPINRSLYMGSTTTVDSPYGNTPTPPPGYPPAPTGNGPGGISWSAESPQSAPGLNETVWTNHLRLISQDEK